MYHCDISRLHIFYSTFYQHHNGCDQRLFWNKASHIDSYKSYVVVGKVRTAKNMRATYREREGR